jgi:hypothetical protein
MSSQRVDDAIVVHADDDEVQKMDEKTKRLCAAFTGTKRVLHRTITVLPTKLSQKSQIRCIPENPEGKLSVCAKNYSEIWEGCIVCRGRSFSPKHEIPRSGKGNRALAYNEKGRIQGIQARRVSYVVFLSGLLGARTPLFIGAKSSTVSPPATTNCTY